MVNEHLDNSEKNRKDKVREKFEKARESVDKFVFQLSKR